MRKTGFLNLSLFFISLSLLSFEISLMRILRLEGFGNFTYSSIAIALTGFGASGTIAYLFKKSLRGKELLLSFYSSLLFIFFVGFSFYISKFIPFDPLRVLWDKNQLFFLLIRVTIYVLPFLSGSFFVIMALFIAPSGRTYFYNLIGSGAGVIVVLIFLYLIVPERILIVPICGAFVSVILLIPAANTGLKEYIFAFTLIAAGFFLFLNGEIRMLPYKDIKQALHYPDARIITRKAGPFGLIEVVKSSWIRSASGLSLAFQGRLPEQDGIYLDGDFLAATNNPGNIESLSYLRFQLQSAVYELYDNPDVFIFPAGGGTAPDRAVVHGAKRITAVDDNPVIISLLKKRFSDRPDILKKTDEFTLKSGNMRSMISISGNKWDIIEIALADTSTSSMGGIYASDTSYILTVEAFKEYLEHLKPNGSISVTTRLKYPPRDLLKIVSIAQKSLAESGKIPAANLIVIRNWSHGTVLIKNSDFTPSEIEKIKEFCSRMFFDTVYYPEIKAGQTNRYSIVKDRVYYSNIIKLLADPESFRQDYLFNIKATTDNRPYFSYFIKIKKLPMLFGEMGKQWLFVIEGGYVVLFVTFIVTSFASLIFIFAPVAVVRHGIQIRKFTVFIYFASIALSYMFIEVLLMEFHRKYIESPIYSNSLILAALLIFSGIGSYTSELFSKGLKRTIPAIIILIDGYLLLILIFSDTLYTYIGHFHIFIKLAVIFIILFPLGFLMGMPFPLAFSALKKSSPETAGWAWSVNCYFSVVATTGAVLLSSNIGFLSLGISAAFFYLAALLSLFFLTGHAERGLI